MVKAATGVVRMGMDEVLFAPQCNIFPRRTYFIADIGFPFFFFFFAHVPSRVSAGRVRALLSPHVIEACALGNQANRCLTFRRQVLPPSHSVLLPEVSPCPFFHHLPIHPPSFLCPEAGGQWAPCLPARPRATAHLSSFTRHCLHAD